MKNPYNFPPEILEANRKIRNRNYQLITLAITGLVIVASIFVFLVYYGLKSTDAFKLAEKEILENTEIQTITGGIKEISLSNGSVSTSTDGGEANFDIYVEGRENNVNVSVNLTKQNDEWTVDELVLN